MIGAKLAGYIILTILSILAIFHILVLCRVIPADIVWAGQADAPTGNLSLLESIALIVTVLFGFLTLMKIGLVFCDKAKIVVKIGIWLMCAYFVLNTIGNFSTGLSREGLIFGPVSLILALLTLRLALEK